MPYKNIVFAKLEKRLLNDHRWYMMSELAQLNYIRFILLAAETYNKIPKNIEAIKKAFKTDQDLKTIENTIKEIKQNYPKFKETKQFYYFGEFETKTNYIPKQAIPRKSQGLPKDGVDKEEEEDKDKDKKKSRKIPLSDEDFIKTLKTNPIYKGIDINWELGKMDTWLLANPNRQKTRRFIVNWLNKIDRPVNIQKPRIMEPKKPEPINEEEHKKVADMIHETAKKMKEI